VQVPPGNAGPSPKLKPGRLDLDLVARRRRPHEFERRAVAEARRHLRRTDDVGEHNGPQSGIVALARKLLIVLWRFATTGEMPAGPIKQAWRCVHDRQGQALILKNKLKFDIRQFRLPDVVASDRSMSVTRGATASKPCSNAGDTTAIPGLVGLVRGGLLDLGHWAVTAFPLTGANDAVAHAAAHAGPFKLTVLKP
jgi:hypothetical protein